MICKNCGNTVNEGDVFCGSCGAKINNEAGAENEKAQPSNAENGQQAENSGAFDPYAQPCEEIDAAQAASENESADGQSKEQISGEKNEVSAAFQNNGLGSENVPSAAAGAGAPAGTNVKTVRINKKALIIVSSVLVAVIAAAFLAYEIYNRAPININLDNYISDQVYTDELLNEYYSDHADDYSDYDLEDNGYDSYGNSDLDVSGADTSNFTNYDYGVGLTVIGYSEYASISDYDYKNIIDWSRLIDDVNAQLAKRKR